MTDLPQGGLAERTDRWLGSSEGRMLLNEALTHGFSERVAIALVRAAFMCGACEGEQWMGEHIVGQLEGMAK